MGDPTVMTVFVHTRPYRSAHSFINVMSGMVYCVAGPILAPDQLVGSLQVAETGLKPHWNQYGLYTGYWHQEKTQLAGCGTEVAGL